MEHIQQPELSAELVINQQQDRFFESGLLSKISRFISQFRAAIAGLGLFAAAESGGGCAHAKFASISPGQEQRNICVITTNYPDKKIDWSYSSDQTEISNSQTRPLFITELIQFLHKKYKGIRVQDMGNSQPSNMSLEEKIQWDIEKFIEAACDDVIGFSLTTEIQKGQFDNSERKTKIYDRIKFFAAAIIFNLERNQTVAREKTAEEEINPLDKLTVTPTSELLSMIARRDFEDLIEDYLLKNYRPDLLPPLSEKTVDEHFQKKIAEAKEYYKREEVEKKQKLKND